MIAIENLSVTFGRTLALDSLTVTIPPGITGVFGPNGSGKSTLLRVVAGLLKPTTGALSLTGSALDHRQESIRRRIGFAGHGTGLYARLTLRENLSLFGSLYGVPSTRPDQMIESLGLGPHSGKAVGELSAGLKRRSAVARALLHEPDLLLLDEPYANVDDEASELISRAIVTWRRADRVALIATHGAKKVRAYANAGVMLQRGRLARFGTYTEVGFVS